MKTSKWLDNGSLRAPRGHHMAKKVHSVFRDLYRRSGRRMEIRSLLLQGLGWRRTRHGPDGSGEDLAVTQARVSDIKRGKISSFSLDLLVRLAARAGAESKLKLVA
jgi:hypothetical protein